MPVNFEAEFRIDDEVQFRDELTGQLNEACAQLGAEFLAHVQTPGQWPVASGKSRDGLEYRLDAEPYGYRLVYFNDDPDAAYSRWVEERWYPFQDQAGVVTRIAARLSADVLGRSSSRVKLLARGGGYAWRDIDVRRLTE